MTQRVLVVGDTILDIYCHGSVSRISPEAPVPVFDSEKEERVLGGAANVAANIRTLSGDPRVEIDYFGFHSLEIVNLLKVHNIECIGVPVAPNEVLAKRRFVCDKIQLLRVDNHKKYSDEDLLAASQLLFSHISLKNYDIVVISDYDKNTIQLSEFDILSESSVPKIIDLKRVRSDMTNFKDGDSCLLKCNQKEHDANPHISYLGAKTIVTTGEGGYWMPQTDERFPRARSTSTNVDVIGAGDVFLAGMAVNYLESGTLEPYAMAAFGNLCASEKVRHFGTVAVKRKLI